MTTKFPYSKEEWLKLRDDRPNRVNGVKTADFSNLTVRLVADDGFTDTRQGQLTIGLTVIQLSRWVGNIQYVGNDKELRILGKLESSLIAFLERIVRDSDPFCSFTVTTDRSEKLLEVYFGEKISGNLWVDNRGWYCGYGYDALSEAIPESRDFNPVGASFTSTLANSELYKQALGISVDQRPKQRWFSIWDYSSHNSINSWGENPAFDSNLDLGRIIQVGCGAVGSCFDLLLSMSDFHGILRLIDFDTVGIENLSTSMGFSVFDAINGVKKVNQCAALLKDTRIETEVFDCDYSKFIKENGRLDSDVILCLANEQNIWSTIQYNLPPVTFHATTTPTWGINIGRHIPIKEWCLVCRFQNELGPAPVLRCEDGQLIESSTKGEKVFGVLPFLPMAAASTLLGELVKLNINQPDKITDNFIRFAFYNSHESNFLLSHRNKATGCLICKDQPIEIYKIFCANSRHWNLSQE